MPVPPVAVAVSPPVAFPVFAPLRAFDHHEAGHPRADHRDVPVHGDQEVERRRPRAHHDDIAGLVAAYVYTFVIPGKS
jgi:hypothetical protein